MRSILVISLAGLVLLVAATFAQRRDTPAAIKLPVTVHPEEKPPSPTDGSITLNVNKDNVLVGIKALPAKKQNAAAIESYLQSEHKKLASKLKKKLGDKKPAIALLLRVDQQARYRAVYELVELGSKIGFTQIQVRALTQSGKECTSLVLTLSQPEKPAAKADPKVLEDVVPDVERVDEIRLLVLSTGAVSTSKRLAGEIGRISFKSPEDASFQVISDEAAGNERHLQLLAKELKKIGKTSSHQVVVVIDASLRHDFFVKVLEACRQSGFKTVTVSAPRDPAASLARDPFISPDVDPQPFDFDTDIKLDKSAKPSVPGIETPAVSSLPELVEPPKFFFPALEDKEPVKRIEVNAPHVRGGKTKEFLLKEWGGTGESEAAVTRGLRWLVTNQADDGHWPGCQGYDVAGTAFGLLPFLGAGFTHKPSPKNPYDKPILKGLEYLIKKQNTKGDFGNGMYAQALATLALCEAYGMSQDAKLRRPAQLAVDFIVWAQHDEGGWRYIPKQHGDLSVTGWQVQALTAAQLAGLTVPRVTLQKAAKFVYERCSDNESYGYTTVGGSPTMTAVGLCCREKLEGWGPKNPRFVTGAKNHLIKHTPGIKNMYYTFYATQVVRNLGGESWQEWNKRTRDELIAAQDKTNGLNSGSWDPSSGGHIHGRIMMTSLCLLTLEVYYRSLPASYQEPAKKKQ